MQTINLTEIDALDITILADNVTDMLLPSQGPAKRPPRSRNATIDARFIRGGRVGEVFTAEHGFSALVSATVNGSVRRTLFDAGMTPTGASENLRRASVDPKDIEAIVFSHGHYDHTIGLEGFARQIGRKNLPVILHPEFWTLRRVNFPGRDPFDMPATSEIALLEAGFQIVQDRRPSFLLDGAVLITGEVSRTADFEKGFPAQMHEAHRNGRWEDDPLVPDDQALIANLRGKGLVVLTGCGHAGIVNIVTHAQKLTGISKVHAVIGGFHLSGGVFEQIIPQTIAALKAIAPAVIVPAHCTGWRAVHGLAAALPESFIQNSVGTRYEFRAG